MYLYVYLSTSPKNAAGLRTPIVIESNLAWALPYWTARKQTNPDLYWTLIVR